VQFGSICPVNNSEVACLEGDRIDRDICAQHRPLQRRAFSFEELEKKG